MTERKILNNSGCIESSAGGLVINVTVQPRASKKRVVGIFNGTVKIAITAPPVDGKANTQVIAMLAKFFELPKTAVFLKSGHRSRQKRFLLKGLTKDSAEELFVAKAGGDK